MFWGTGILRPYGVWYSCILLCHYASVPLDPGWNAAFGETNIECAPDTVEKEQLTTVGRSSIMLLQQTY